MRGAHSPEKSICAAAGPAVSASRNSASAAGRTRCLAMAPEYIRRGLIFQNLATPNSQLPTPKGSVFERLVLSWELEVGSWTLIPPGQQRTRFRRVRLQPELLQHLVSR